jgi:hypothetical protein
MVTLGSKGLDDLLRPASAAAAPAAAGPVAAASAAETGRDIAEPQPNIAEPQPVQAAPITFIFSNHSVSRKSEAYDGKSTADANTDQRFEKAGPSCSKN